MDPGYAHGSRPCAQGDREDGTIRHVNALGGYVTARSGQRFVFYAAVNHHPGPSSDSAAALDAIAALVAAL